MNKQEALQRVRDVCRVRRLSRHTEDTYAGWIARFIEHVRRCGDVSREERIRLFLERLAPVTAASTQNQALNAIVFFYRDVIKEPLGDIGKWARARRPKRLPSWLTTEEMGRLLEQMRGMTKLMAEMAYGGGLRIAELLALRMKDVDMAACTITVRGGKGDKDRVTCLPRSLAMRLGPYVARVRALWERDCAAGAPPVYLPDGLGRKFPNGGREWPWFWFWPATGESTDPHSGIGRRHHVHEHTLGKALKRAATHAGLSKRVTAHTLRHSFATALLESGAGIHQVQELLGHASIETTQKYLHCLPLLGTRIVSPLDMAAERKVVAFPAVERQQQGRGECKKEKR